MFVFSLPGFLLFFLSCLYVLFNLAFPSSSSSSFTVLLPFLAFPPDPEAFNLACFHLLISLPFRFLTFFFVCIQKFLLPLLSHKFPSSFSRLSFGLSFFIPLLITRLPFFCYFAQFFSLVFPHSSLRHVVFLFSFVLFQTFSLFDHFTLSASLFSSLFLLLTLYLLYPTLLSFVGPFLSLSSSPFNSFCLPVNLILPSLVILSLPLPCYAFPPSSSSFFSQVTQNTIFCTRVIFDVVVLSRAIFSPL